MSKYDDALKQKHWNDLKAAVGTMVSQKSYGGGSMNLDDLLLNIKDVDFASLVSQAQIKTADDKALYSRQGYDILLTADELKEKFNVDPSCVWYSKSFAYRTLYFNPETLAAAPFHLELLLSGSYPNFEESFIKAIETREAEVAAGDYQGSLTALPDAMQMEYFNRLIEKKGSGIPGLYELFFSNYINSDYGFSGVKPDTLKAILASKMESDREKMQEALKDLPDKVKIYRGGNTASAPYTEAFSWSLDKNVANFFACRRGSGQGYLVEAEIPKEDIIEAFLDDRNEREVFVCPDDVKILNEISIHGLDYLKTVLPAVAPMYH